MKQTFILVHDASNNGAPVVVNTTTISAIQKSELYTGASTLHDTVYSGLIERPFLHVTETPEQIYEMLK